MKAWNHLDSVEWRESHDSASVVLATVDKCRQVSWIHPPVITLSESMGLHLAWTLNREVTLTTLTNFAYSGIRCVHKSCCQGTGRMGSCYPARGKESQKENHGVRLSCDPGSMSLQSTSFYSCSQSFLRWYPLKFRKVLAFLYGTLSSLRRELFLH